MSQMKEIKIEKLTLNFGAGADQKKLAKGVKLIESITGVTPVKTKAKKRIPAWGCRPGLPIGAKLTLRGDEAKKLLVRLLAAKDNLLSLKSFDDNGNISFGIHEYVDIPGVKYDPELGIIGLETSVTLSRPGFRIKTRKIMKRKIPSNHRISKDDSINFLKSNFGLKIIEEEDENDL